MACVPVDTLYWMRPPNCWVALIGSPALVGSWFIAIRQSIPMRSRQFMALPGIGWVI